MPRWSMDCIPAAFAEKEMSMDTNKQAHVAALDALRAKLRERFKNVRKLQHTEEERREYLRSRPAPSLGVLPSKPMTEQERKEQEEYIQLHRCPF